VDPFFGLLTRIDVEVRLGRALPDLPQEKRVGLLKRKFRAAVQPWDQASMAAIQSACRKILPVARKYSSRFVPKQWKFVRTDGSDEAHAAYTRHDVIVLPAQRMGGMMGAMLPKLVAHETVHVFTRKHPGMRDKLYARLGFKKVGRIDLGSLAPRWLTNPDCPVVEHVISIKHDGKQQDAALVIYSKSEFEKPHPMALFASLRLGLFPVEKTEAGAWRLREPAGKGLAFGEVGGFFEQIGRNTNYTIHPEEILAENLALLLSGAPRVREPKLLEDLGAILKAGDR